MNIELSEEELKLILNVFHIVADEYELRVVEEELMHKLENKVNDSKTD